MNYIDEAEVQNRVATENTVQNGILTALNISAPVDFIKEDTYINGITADFTIADKESINAIVECKAGNINVTDYVRGIGQLFQYEYFMEKISLINHISILTSFEQFIFTLHQSLKIIHLILPDLNIRIQQ